MKPFRFQQFEIKQSKSVFRVGTDGVLLGAMCNVQANKVLEVGTGTGLIALMIAQRNASADILAIDINAEAVRLSSENFENSPFSSRIKAINTDFKAFPSSEKYDLVVSNPPYFDENTSEKDVLARQRVELDFCDLIRKTSEILAENGCFSVIIPADFGTDFIELCKENQLYLMRKINIKGIAQGKVKRLILEFSFQNSSYSEKDFVVEKSPRHYSDEYLELTKDFHIFRK